MNIQITREVIGGTTYLSAPSVRGKTTTVWAWGRDIFVTTGHRSAPRHINDIAKPSKVALALINELRAA